MMILPLVLLGILVYYLLKNKDIKKILNSNKTPEETLKERYVNGEIDEETFKRMKETLK